MALSPCYPSKMAATKLVLIPWQLTWNSSICLPFSCTGRISVTFCLFCLQSCFFHSLSTKGSWKVSQLPTRYFPAKKIYTLCTCTCDRQTGSVRKITWRSKWRRWRRKRTSEMWKSLAFVMMQNVSLFFDKQFIKSDSCKTRQLLSNQGKECEIMISSTQNKGQWQPSHFSQLSGLYVKINI